MDTKYYMHRIQIENGTSVRGIEVHDTLDSAILSFHGRMKLGYDNSQYPNLTYVACKVTDAAGKAVEPYDDAWLKESEEPVSNHYFLHFLRLDGETLTKNIDEFLTLDAAKRMLHTYMEYGYNNSKHPNVSMVSCMITDLLSGGMVLVKEYWEKPAEPEPEPEPETEQEETQE